jgi:hypothetical protein
MDTGGSMALEQSNEEADDPGIAGLAPPGPDVLGSGYKPLVFTPGSQSDRLGGLPVPTQSGPSASTLAQPYQGI